MAAKAELVPDFRTKKDVLVEITQEIAKDRLGKLVAGAEENYNSYKDGNSEDDKKLAAYWFSQMQAAVEKLLRASGVYEKAKKEAERAPTANKITVTVNWQKGVKPS